MTRIIALILFAASVQFSVAQDSARRTKPQSATVPPRSTAAQPGTAYGSRPATGSSYTQATPPANTDKSLNGQYQYLTTKLYGYQRAPLAAFYKIVTDSLRIQRQKLVEAQRKLANQNKDLKDLQSDVSAKEQSLNEQNARVDSISLLGIPVTKSTYNMITWGLVIIFGIIAAIVIAQSGSARREARYRSKLYEDLEEEYKSYKVKANEKEKKLARELQTVRNKLEEITGNPEY